MQLKIIKTILCKKKAVYLKKKVNCSHLLNTPDALLLRMQRFVLTVCPTSLYNKELGY